jgi:hypothetical protein
VSEREGKRVIKSEKEVEKERESEKVGEGESEKERVFILKRNDGGLGTF